MYGLSTQSEKRYTLELCNDFQLRLLSSVSVHNRLKGCNYVSQFCEELFFTRSNSLDTKKYALVFLKEKVL